jgi:4-amino-4-deoxy-L-arabinose transferase-like glycosyltransferase
MKKYYLEAGLGLAIVFELLFRLGRVAFIGDDSTYAFRAVNLVDFMFSGRQTTPWQWFNPLPWWIDLSFHDAPPLFFWLEHWSFRLFGVSSLTALIVPMIAGCVSSVLIYLIVRQCTGQKPARLALIVLLCLNPFIWLHRLALLESVMMPLILLCWYGYLKAEQDKRWYWLVGAAGGLALLTKYTAVFLIVAILIHLTWKRRADWHSPHWWRAVIGGLIILSPVLLYNYFLWLTRGHFDVQLAAAFGQSNADWPILNTRVNWDIFSSVSRLIFTTSALYSWPLLLLSLWSFYRWVHYRPQRPLSSAGWFSGLMAISWLCMIILTKVDDRFIATGYVFPILIICACWPKGSWSAWSRGSKIYSSCVIAILLFSWLYMAATNYAQRPWGLANVNYSDSRRETSGFDQVEHTISSALYHRKPVVVLEDQFTVTFDPLKSAQRRYDPQTIALATNEQEAAPIIIYDRNTNWFTSLWYFYRWSFYQGQVVLSTQEAASLLDDPSQEFLKAVKGRVYIVFMTTEYSLRDQPKYQSPPFDSISQLESSASMKYIFDDYGQPVWQVYQGRF